MQGTIKYVVTAYDNFSATFTKMNKAVSDMNKKVKELAKIPVSYFSPYYTKMQKSISDTSKKTKELAQGAVDAGSQMALAAGSMGLFAGYALKSAANIETMQLSFQTLLQDIEKGNALFKQVQSYAALTPFSQEDVGDAAKLMLSASIPAEKVLKMIEGIGDIAAGTGRPLMQLASVFQQVITYGKLYTQEYKQFATAGINMGEILSKKLGKSQEQIYDMLEKGKISSKVALEVLMSLREEGGMFYQATAKQSTSLAGLFSTLKDNINIASGALGNNIVFALDLKNKIQQLSDFISRLADGFKNLSPFMQKVVGWSVVLITLLSPMLIIVGQLGLGVFFLAKAFGFLGTTAVVLAKAFLPTLGVLAAIATALAAIVYGYKAYLIIKAKITGDKELMNTTLADVDKMNSFVASAIVSTGDFITNGFNKLTATSDVNVNISGAPAGSKAEAKQSSSSNWSPKLGLNMATQGGN